MPLRLLSPFKELFGLGHVAAVVSLIGTAAILALAVYWFFRLAPPYTLLISSGPEDSAFQTNAVKYRDILAREGIQLQILSSEGSLENLQRLYDPTIHVDIAFVQGGISNAPQGKEVLSSYHSGRVTRAYSTIAREEAGAKARSGVQWRMASGGCRGGKEEETG